MTGAKQYLRRFRPLRHAWNTLTSAWFAVTDSRARVASFDSLYTSRPDPYGYARASERERHSTALRLLADRIGPDQRTCLEIGCAEGVFTGQLCSLGLAVTGMDFSQIALERARERNNGSHAVFVCADVRTWPIATFDVVCVMDVISVFSRPAVIRDVLRRARHAVAPGGILLVSDVRIDPALERSWWSTAFIRGGLAIVEEALTDPAFETPEVVLNATHAIGAAVRRADAGRARNSEPARGS